MCGLNQQFPSLFNLSFFHFFSGIEGMLEKGVPSMRGELEVSHLIKKLSIGQCISIHKLSALRFKMWCPAYLPSCF